MNMETGVAEILVFLTSAFDEANDHLDATWERTEIPTAILDVVRKAKLALLGQDPVAVPLSLCRRRHHHQWLYSPYKDVGRPTPEVSYF
jgi:hypothetical protein